MRAIIIDRSESASFSRIAERSLLLRIRRLRMALRNIQRHSRYVGHKNGMRCECGACWADRAIAADAKRRK